MTVSQMFVDIQFFLFVFLEKTVGGALFAAFSIGSDVDARNFTFFVFLIKRKKCILKYVSVPEKNICAKGILNHVNFV